jgi:hypothetical protein
MSKRKRGNPTYQAMYGPFSNNPAGNALGLSEMMYIRILTELSCNRFKWIGLPDSVDERFLELTLFNQALAVFYFEDRFGRYLCQRATSSGMVNHYDNPTTFTVIGNGSANLSRTLNAGNTWEEVKVVEVDEKSGETSLTTRMEMRPAECVPIWGNYLRVPDKDIIYVFAQRLAKIDQIIMSNLEAMAFTHIVAVPEEKRMTYMNILKQRRDGQPVLFGVEGLGADIEQAIKAWPVAPDKDVPLNLQISKSRIWNECMTLLGINNANQDKKERVVSDEVESNNDQVVSNRGIALNSRKIGVAQINARWGLSLDVGWNPMAGAMAGEYAIIAGVKPEIEDGQEETEDA